MRISRNKAYFWIILAAFWLLNACAVGDQSPTTLLPTASPRPTELPTRTITASPTASQTPTRTLPPTRTATITSTPCVEAHGRIQIYSIKTDLLRKPWEVRVYFPPCFTSTAKKPYPVLYMLHGQSFLGDQWDNLGIDEAADELISSHKTPAFLIIMPYEADSLVYPGDAKYDQAVVEALLPWAEAQFPICRERACRAVGGLSRGAGWAMRLGFKYWQVFGAVGGHSLTPFGADIEYYPVWQAKIPAGETPRLYIDIGEKDRYLKPATNFKDWLIELNIPVEWHLNPGTHNEEYWSNHVREYLLWYAEGF